MDDEPHSSEKRGWLQEAKHWAKKKLTVISENSDTLKAIRRYSKVEEDVEKERSQASSSRSVTMQGTEGPWESPPRGWQGELERQHVMDEDGSQAVDRQSNLSSLPSASELSRGQGWRPQLQQGGPVGQFAKVFNSKSPDSKLDRVRLVQNLPAHEGIIWCAALSRDQTMLATGGQDSVLRVWCIIPAVEPTEAKAGTSTTQSLPIQRKLGHSRKASSFSALDSLLWSGGPIPTPEPVIDSKPFRVFEGHAEDIIDLSWSKGNMILSASVDKTVKLWHLNETGCLRTFTHPDFVTSVRFHPLKLQWFATGCADGRVRLWDIPGTKVLASSVIQHDMITAVAFTSDQKIIVGSLKGVCRFYQYNPLSQQMPARGGGTVSIMSFVGAGTSHASSSSSSQGQQNKQSLPAPGKLEYLTQVDVKDQRSSSSSSGSKITGLLVMPNDDSLIVTSADSRLRRYLGYAQQCKYKGHKATSTLIRASLSPCGQHVMCGSEDGKVYLWDTYLQGEQRDYSNPFGPANGRAAYGGGGFDPSASLAPKPKVKNMTFESFATDEDTVTIALMAPHFAWRSGLRSGAISGHGDLDGAVFIVAGFGGSIRCYENLLLTGGPSSRVTREE